MQIYGPDFDLFGYNSTKYFDIVKSNKPPIQNEKVSAIATAKTPP